MVNQKIERPYTTCGGWQESNPRKRSKLQSPSTQEFLRDRSINCQDPINIIQSAHKSKEIK